MLPVFAHQRNLKYVIQELISPLCPTFDISGVGIWATSEGRTLIRGTFASWFRAAKRAPLFPYRVRRSWEKCK
jgi:hypothetical protein